MMAEGFDLPVGEGCRECGRKGCSSTSAARLYSFLPHPALPSHHFLYTLFDISHKIYPSKSDDSFIIFPVVLYVQNKVFIIVNVVRQRDGGGHDVLSLDFTSFRMGKEDF